jgi:hypothetical protein
VLFCQLSRRGIGALADGSRQAKFLRDHIAFVVSLISVVVKYTGPVRPLDQTVRSGVVDGFTPFVPWHLLSFRSSKSAVDTTIAAGQKDNSRKLSIEREVVNNKAVEFEAPEAEKSVFGLSPL